MLLRIEDTDAERSQPELIEAIFRALDWLGIDWDGEPVHQSDRLAGPRRRRRAPAGRGPGLPLRLHPGRGEGPQRRRPAARPATTASAATATCRPARASSCASAPPTRAPPRSPTWSGARSRSRTPTSRTSSSSAATGLPMFLVANAVDDAAMGITHIVRGEDLINVTPKVLLLRQALGIDGRPGLRPPAADRQRAAQEAVEAPRRRVGRRLHRPRLPARGHGQLPGHRSAGARPTASRSARSARSSTCSASRTSTRRAPSSTSRSSPTSTASTSASSAARRVHRALPAVAHRPDRAVRRGPPTPSTPTCSPPWPRSCRSGSSASTRCPATSTSSSSTSPSSTTTSWQKVMVKGHDRAVHRARRQLDALRRRASGPSPAHRDDAVIGSVDANELKPQQGPGPDPGGRHRSHRSARRCSSRWSRSVVTARSSDCGPRADSDRCV